MKTVGIIAELNPFHNGHGNLIRRAKEETKADHCIVVMSGDYVQRGAPAIVEKYSRARMALVGGADLVLELPLYYSLGSAEYFALGAVTLLNKLGVVDCLAFGAEDPDIDGMMSLVDILVNEPPEYKLPLQVALKNGDSFPVARKKALSAYLPRKEKDKLKLLDTRNNILAIEYLKALKATRSTIEPKAFLRTEGVSAEDIRESLLSSYSRIRKSMMPESCAVLLREYPVRTGYSYGSTDAFSDILRYLLTMQSSVELERIVDMNTDLAGRLNKVLPSYSTFDSFARSVKTKDITYTRLSRSLMHIILSMTKDNMNQYVKAGSVYARALGFRSEAEPLLSGIKMKGTAPLITKLSSAKKMLGGDLCAFSLLQETIRASALYDAVFIRDPGQGRRSEFEKPIVIL